MSCKVGPLLIRNGVLGPLSMAKIKWVTGIIITPTLPPITMEVENGVLEDVFSLQIGYFPLPWLWEEGQPITACLSHSNQFAQRKSVCFAAVLPAPRIWFCVAQLSNQETFRLWKAFISIKSASSRLGWVPSVFIFRCLRQCHSKVVVEQIFTWKKWNICPKSNIWAN